MSKVQELLFTINSSFPDITKEELKQKVLETVSRKWFVTAEEFDDIIIELRERLSDY